MRRPAQLVLLAAGLLVPAAAGAHPGHGPEQVEVGGFAFSPSDLTVRPGDTIIWVWKGPDLDHTVTADPGQAESFDSDPGGNPDHAQDDSFAHQFDVSGTYTYHCQVHPDLMKGKVNVLPPRGGGSPPPDDGGGGGSGTPDADDSTAPSLTRVRIGKRRRRVGFTVDESATVLVRIERRRHGRWRLRRDYDVSVNAGRTRARLRLRGLAPGLYRVRLRAYDAADNRSPSASARFRIH